MIKMIVKFFIGSLLPFCIFSVVNLALNHDTKQARAPAQQSRQTVEQSNVPQPPSRPSSTEAPKAVQKPSEQVETPTYVTDVLPHTGESRGRSMMLLGVLVVGTVINLKRRKRQ